MLDICKCDMSLQTVESDGSMRKKGREERDDLRSENCSIDMGRSSAPSHLDPLGRSDPTARESDPALNSAVPTAAAAELAASADYSPFHQDQRVMPAGPNHSGAALIPSTIVGEAVGREQRPFTAATVGSSYGLESETMTIHRAYSTSAEATPSSASELRLAKPQTGLTSDRV